jgi:membrane fusion protein (multidrug efflux system)
MEKIMMKTMKTCYRNSIAILLITLVLISGCRKPDMSSNAQAQQGPPGGPPGKMGGAPLSQEKIVSVMAYQTRPDTVSRYLRLTGGLEAGSETFVYSQSTAKLDNIKVKTGEAVKANQVLAIQSSRTFQESVKEAEAALQSAIAQEELAQQNHARNKQLFEEQIISKQSFEQTATGVKTAALTVEQTQARLAQAKEQQGNTVITAPFAGKVAQILFNKGDMVTSGSAVFKIVNTGTFKATLDVPEAEAANVSLGQIVLASFPAIPDAEFSGTITRIDEAIDPEKRALEIEVSFANSTGDPMPEQDDQTQPAEQADASSAAMAQSQGDFAKLKSGQFGQFEIEIQRHENAVVIPDNAMMSQTEVQVNERGEQTTLKTYYVYVVEQGKAVKKIVTPGIYSSGRVELTAGLNIGEAVIVTGQNTVKDGAAVAIVNQQARVE